MEELILGIGLAAGVFIFPYCPVDEATRGRIDPVEHQEIHMVRRAKRRRGKYQYYPFK